MKDIFQEPDFAIVRFCLEDIIAVSSPFDIPDPGENETPFDPISL